ncbi:cytochrome bc complex cytochrome b subunit [Streptomyces sp. NPDC101209]|uniref:cytochrome bc1 complex cytochrome b subunit n=1 Tax=Streptomyces sp. NPDC101209 TaxID=3366129 RepID=UPI0037F8119B
MAPQKYTKAVLERAQVTTHNLKKQRGSSRGERLADWADARLGLYTMAKTNMRKIFPDHWSFMLGEVCLWSFAVLILTGIYLTFFFHPSMNEVVYHGSYRPLNGITMSEAFASTLNISFEVRGGLLIRQMHHWAALIMVAGMFIHMMRHFFTGSFRKPREMNWVFGWIMLILGMFEGFVGYSLPDDLLSGTGLRFVEGAILSVPIVGTYLTMFFFGGEFPGTDIVPRLYSVHVLLLPAIIAALIVVHMMLLVYHKHTQWAGPGRTNRNVVGMPFLPVYLAKTSGFFFLVSSVIAAISAVASINPVWTYGPYRPDQVSTDAQPDWYMGFSEGLIRIMPGWEINVGGHTLNLGVLIPLIVFPIVLLTIGLYPFFEGWVTGDSAEHHVLDRPRNRPVRTGLGVAWLSAYFLLLLGGGNDLFATRFHLSINSVTWSIRIALFVVPVAAFLVTRRICLSLQSRDNEKILHGKETGVIRRLPHGEYVEVHKSLTAAELHTLTAHEQYAPFDPGPAHDANGIPRKLSHRDRIRMRLSRGFYGPSSQVAKPTQAELQQEETMHGIEH